MVHHRNNQSRYKNKPQPEIQQFRAYTIKHSGVANRIVTEVKLTKPFDPQTTPPESVSFYDTTALWDTGATKSLVTTATADTFGLTPVGNARMNHAGGSGDVNTYLVNIFLPNMVVFPNVLVTECHNIAGDFGAIIGMDIICTGDFSITNVNKQTCMSFRFPSCNTIDYVLEANRIKFAGIKKTAPCPCGALSNNGKRIIFGDCHGKDM